MVSHLLIRQTEGISLVGTCPDFSQVSRELVLRSGPMENGTPGEIRRVS